MRKRSGNDPYNDFLSAHRRLATTADAVLGQIGEFGRLKSKEDFQAALKLLNEEQDAEWKKPTRFYTAIERQLRQPALDHALVKRLGLVCRAAEVALGHTPWHHQVVCALLLNLGLIVEMPNGSGKTLAVALAAAVNSSSGKRTHVTTSNDYLSERDMRWMGPIYQLLDLSVGVCFSDQSVHFEYGILDSDGITLRVSEKDFSRSRVTPVLPALEAAAALPNGNEELKPAAQPEALTQSVDVLRHETTANYVIDAYIEIKDVLQCHIVYGRIENLGHAYLKDNMQLSPELQVITQRDMLIVDECDAVLIDDLRTPLIITENTGEDSSNISRLRPSLHQLARTFVSGRDFSVADREVTLTYEGLQRVNSSSDVDFFTGQGIGLAHGLINALKALHAYRRDEDYIVRGNEIEIIEQDTGRLLQGRRYNDGLHEALEVKEGLYETGDGRLSMPAARITIKNFVRAYRTVAGLSGTIGSPEEYKQFYGLECISLQPFSPSRNDHPDIVFRTQPEARHETVRFADEISQRGQPVLINVPTLQDIDQLSQLFRRMGVSFQALDPRNIRNMEEEAESVKLAGRPGLITICSKLAARGTDIVVSPDAKNAGGLYVIGLERGLTRRYDDQLRGRAGRHGDPGDSVFILSLDDELMSIFAGPSVKKLMRYLGMEENVAIESPMVTRRIFQTQRNIERHERNQRRQVVDVDDTLERHRMVFYDLRQKILTKEDLESEFQTITDNWVDFKGQTILKSLPGKVFGRTSGVFGSLEQYFDNVEIERIFQITSKRKQQNLLRETLRRKVQSKIEELHQNNSIYVLRYLLLNSLDKHWTQYLQFSVLVRNESNLYFPDMSRVIAKYAKAMEERFDSFFYEIGENVLSALLGLQFVYERPPASLN